MDARVNGVAEKDLAAFGPKLLKALDGLNTGGADLCAFREMLGDERLLFVFARGESATWLATLLEKALNGEPALVPVKHDA